MAFRNPYFYHASLGKETIILASLLLDTRTKKNVRFLATSAPSFKLAHAQNLCKAEASIH
jgi:hypothetical protein